MSRGTLFWFHLVCLTPRSNSVCGVRRHIEAPRAASCLGHSNRVLLSSDAFSAIGVHSRSPALRLTVPRAQVSCDSAWPATAPALRLALNPATLIADLPFLPAPQQIPDDSASRGAWPAVPATQGPSPSTSARATAAPRIAAPPTDHAPEHSAGARLGFWGFVAFSDKRNLGIQARPGRSQAARHRPSLAARILATAAR